MTQEQICAGHVATISDAKDMTGVMKSSKEQAAKFPDGPSVVAIGGGHGQAKSLIAIRQFAKRVTAIVSVADNGGSSGRLRDAFGIPAPGDLRKCLDALLPEVTPLGDALEHRFEAGELEGHAFGNLLLAALTATMDDFVGAVAEACRLLDTVGDVWPATVTPVTLCASTGEAELAGQVQIGATEGITRVSLAPEDARSPERAIAAITEADLIVLGPGSLYTSVLAALAPHELGAAVRSASAKTVYVCNLRQQVPETADYDVGRHVSTLIAHDIVPDVVLADFAAMDLGHVPDHVKVVEAHLTGTNSAVHDAVLLANELERLFS
jgi:uncharacterized cofD-like protein